MKVLYLDLCSGISGDMFLGALVDLGVDIAQIEAELVKLGLGRLSLRANRETRSGIAGVLLRVESTNNSAHTHNELHQHSEPRDFAQIQTLIRQSELSAWVKAKSIAVFKRIAEAEGKIHGVPTDQVHFHEIGAVDSIVDIVGVCLGLEILGKPRVFASHVVDGTGWIKCDHGLLPVPAPATLEILSARHIPLTQCAEPHELVTPTGAALLAEFVERFGPMRGLIAEKIGYGLGSRENKTRPNILRVLLGEMADISSNSSALDWLTDTVTVLETNLDDINAEILGQFMENALLAGALDVFYTPIQMKKNRPGVLLTLLCTEPDADRFSELILRETSAFGVRRYTAERRKLHREFVTVSTPYGDVKVKLGKLSGKTLHAAPEFESCRELAERTGVSLRQVYEAALKALNH